ncbi:hypothetical protein HYO05_23195 [Vibrio parahaemolyticus]|uniref:papain fold toxin domain-containing protein n=1 Tax=Vibrio parahaemolyticus TaxID=670 RepID=UPI00084B0B06|nr:papain fold toxin domain-containing protein [Vibrio parahaemolyticus]EGQ8047695.1 hypothetical protein [Vibrio parahaemolyticus]EGR3365999.1 hypothetical protein [Vibrio parahaemolyticus]EHH2867033.1 hypothetical protein [Vibrio parahaemolyticus]ELA9316603.1 hypothetical protein [Vibrio parahaemolyticus]ELB2051506.1 hypothetical protein [Vibrio parahaemolyticus]
MATPFEVAGKYKNQFECMEYVNALCKHGFQGEVLVIDTQKIITDNDKNLNLIIMNIEQEPNRQISNTGLHYAFLIGDMVYDNVYPKGVKKEEWVSSFSYPIDLTDTLHPITDKHIREITQEEFLSIKST